MGVIAQMLHDLGFERVVGILDRNQSALKDELSAQFPSYRFEVIPAEDVRTKPARPGKGAVEGLLDEKMVLREECRASVTAMFDRITGALEGSESR